MRHPRPIVLALSTATLLLAACGEATEESPPAGDEPEQVEQLPDGEDEQEDAAADDVRDATEAAIADAAAERGTTEDAIEVVRAEEVEWPDGALGCPQAGETYTQALVPGYLVVLEVDGEEVHYHAAEGEPPFHCEDPQSPTQDS